MKNQYVDALQEGDYVNDYFIAIRKDLRNKQNGGKFLGMVFKDKTGDVGGVMWTNATEVARLFEVGDVVNVRGKAQRYQNRMQLVVDQVLPLKESDYDLDELVDSAVGSDEDKDAFVAILQTIKQPELKALVDSFLEDEPFMTAFAGAAAAKKWHHEFRGGLLRHCYEMARIAETICELYPAIDRDLLMTGVFIHDIGKLHELSHDMFVDYTTAGKLVGHLQIGCEMVQKKVDNIPDFPEHTRLQLMHFVLSHHGELEFGSPIVPKTLEAIVLHHIDNLDAQAAAFTRIIGEANGNQQEWSDYQNLIERVIWTKGGTRPAPEEK